MFPWLLAAFLAAGWCWGALAQPLFPRQIGPYLDHYLTVEGVVDHLPEDYPDRLTYTISDPVLWMGKEKLRPGCRIEVAWYKPMEARSGQMPAEEDSVGDTVWEAGGHSVRSGVDGCAQATEIRHRLLPGKKVKLEGRLELPAEPGNPGQFNYRDWLARKGIFARLTAEGTPIIVDDLAKGLVWRGRRLAAGIRLEIEQGIASALDDEAGSFVKGLLLGAGEGMAPEDRELYQTTGVMHLFAVSGLNLGYLLLFLLLIARWCRLRSGSTLVLVTAGLWGYAALLSFAPSVTRAAVMGSVGTAAYIWNRRQTLLYTMVLALFLLTLADPAAIGDPGLQLSFAATVGIVTLTPGFTRHLSFLPSWLSDSLAVALSAQLAVIPLTALYFQQLPLAGLLANLAVIPLAGLAVLSATAGMLFTILIPGGGTPFFWGAGALSFPIKAWLRLFSTIPGSNLTVTPPSWWLTTLYYLALLLVAAALTGDFRIAFPHFDYRPSLSRLRVPSLLALALSLLLIGWGWGSGTGKLMVTVISVGEGDAVLVRFPNGGNMLVDAGGKPAQSRSAFDPGRQVVLPYLGRLGIRRLDLLVNTHPHEDHLGGMPAILQGMKVEQMVTAPVIHPTPLMLQVEKLSAERGIPISQVAEGSELRVDPAVKIMVLNPPSKTFSGTRSDLNNNSLVLKIAYRRTSFLLTGDIEKEAMAGLAERYRGSRMLSADLCKISHHGSKYGLYPGFAALVNPSYGIISVGDNSFGHPDPATLSFWRQRGVKLWRTDRDGAVTATSDGNTLEVTAENISR